jgi:hypothetical protein
VRSLERPRAASVSLNEVHQIRTPATGAGAFDGRGILVINTRASHVTRNTVMHAGQAGVIGGLRLGARTRAARV